MKYIRLFENNSNAIKYVGDYITIHEETQTAKINSTIHKLETIDKFQNVLDTIKDKYNTSDMRKVARINNEKSNLEMYINLKRGSISLLLTNDDYFIVRLGDRWGDTYICDGEENLFKLLDIIVSYPTLPAYIQNKI